MKHTKELLLVTIEDLVASPHNVRRYAKGEVEELAALIASQGLLLPLIVTEQPAGRGRHQVTKFGVVAGERRRRALVLLRSRGLLPAGYEVPCELVDAERAAEISLAENSGREPMHPADEFEAFQALVQAGRSTEDVAARFGVSVLTVQRRLKLAALSPRLIALYREDGINLDQLMALTLTDDHGGQERAWFDAQPWERTAVALRRVLTRGQLLAHQSALAKFVGIEAYEAAGGIVRRDLFDSDDDCWITEADLLHRLAQEKLERLANEVLREGWLWVEARIEVDGRELREYGRREPVLRTPSPDEKRALMELEERARELDAERQALENNDTWTPADGERIDLEEQDIAVRRRAIQAGMQVWAERDKAVAGVIVTVGRDGEADVRRGLLRPGDRRVEQAAARLDAGSTVDGVDGTGSADENVRERGYSEALLRRLAAQKTAAMQAVLAQGRSTALVALTHALALQVFERYGAVHSALQLSARPSGHELLRAADDLPASRAWVELEALRMRWIERLPQDEDGWLGWLAQLPLEELLDLLAACAASLALVPVELHQPQGHLRILRAWTWRSGGRPPRKASSTTCRRRRSLRRWRAPAPARFQRTLRR